MKRNLIFCTIFLFWGAFLLSIPAQAHAPAAENSNIDCWRGSQGSEKCYTYGTDRDVPYWTQDGSGNDSYRWNVYFNNNGDLMCTQWRIGSGSWNYTGCSYVGDGDHWSCLINTGQNVASQTVTFEFYNSDDDDTSAGNICDITGDEEAWSGQRSFNTDPTAVELIDLNASVRPSLVPAAALAGAALLGLGLVVWRVRQR